VGLKIERRAGQTRQGRRGAEGDFQACGWRGCCEGRGKRAGRPRSIPAARSRPRAVSAGRCRSLRPAGKAVRAMPRKCPAIPLLVRLWLSPTILLLHRNHSVRRIFFGRPSIDMRQGVEDRPDGGRDVGIVHRVETRRGLTGPCARRMLKCWDVEACSMPTILRSSLTDFSPRIMSTFRIKSRVGWASAANSAAALSSCGRVSRCS